MLKERLCFDPEFWNLLTLRTHCLELMSDKVMKAAVLSDMKEQEEKEQSEELVTNQCLNASCVNSFNSCQCPDAAVAKQDIQEEQAVNREREKCASLLNDAHLKRRKWRKRLRRREQAKSDDEAEFGDDPEITYNLKSTSVGNKPAYSLRYNHSNKENSASVKLPLNRKREYLSRRVKSQIFKRKGKKRRWLQGLPKLEQVPTVKEKKVKVLGKKRGRKPLVRLEFSYPDNEMVLPEEEFVSEEANDSGDKRTDMFDLETKHKQESDHKENQPDQTNSPEEDNGLEEVADTDFRSSVDAQTQVDPQTQLFDGPAGEPQSAVPAVEADRELDGPPLELFTCPVEQFHSYCIKQKNPDDEEVHTAEPTALDEPNGDTEEELQRAVETEMSSTEVSCFICRCMITNTCIFAGLPGMNQSVSFLPFEIIH